MNPFSRTDRWGLAWNIVGFLLAVLLTNGLIAINNPHEMSSYQETALTPPGFVIGIVWTALFVCMAVARWLLLRSQAAGAPSSARLVVFLGVLCLSYPAYTLGLRSETIGLIGNLVTLVVTLGILAHSYPRSRTAALWTAPIAVWLSYASFLSVLAVRSQ